MSTIEEILASIPVREHYEDDGDEMYVNFDYAHTLERLLRLAVSQRDGFRLETCDKSIDWCNEQLAAIAGEA